MKRNIFLSLYLLLVPVALTVLCPSPAVAQVKEATEIRYVSKNGKYSNDGKSWATAKKNVQDAINDLVDRGLKGEVWVQQGVYTPTESTEQSGGNTLYMSFKIPAGINVRGGFLGPAAIVPTLPDGAKLYSNGTEVAAGTANYPGETLASDRARRPIRSFDYKLTDADGNAVKTVNAQIEWSYVFHTTLSGNLSQEAKFSWNEKLQRWNTSYYGNSYHVVFFATNKFDDEGHAYPLDAISTVEGFDIRNGNAHSTVIGGHPHNAYGGGVYMVKNARLENCRVYNCEASRDGGGVYMDGGGIVTNCHIFNNQALGIGVDNGYGGGLCMADNGHLGATDLMGVYRTHITGNVGRMGGGLAVKVENSEVPGTLSEDTPGTVPLPYRVFGQALLVANNTAMTEGGGVYTLKGGAFAHMTCVRNKCNGTGIIINDMLTGRAGGMYSRDRALILNSVFWGNECEANNNVQYAATKTSAMVTNVDMQFCAVSNADFADWSAVKKSSVFNIAAYNDYTDAYKALGSSASRNDHYPNFLLVPDSAGHVRQINGTRGADGKVTADGGAHYMRTFTWQPNGNSALANAGIMSADLNVDHTYPFTTLATDLLGSDFVSRSTIGAYTRELSARLPMRGDQFPVTFNADGSVATYKSVDMDGAGVGTDPEHQWHFFVDVERATISSVSDYGGSWDSPVKFLNNVFYSINVLREKGQIGTEDMVYVHVKEGTHNNTESYTNDNVRNIYFNVPAYVTILGGYSQTLTGTQIDENESAVKRNPVKYPTFITGEITGELMMNANRLFAIGNDIDTYRNITIDGLHLRYGNSISQLFDEPGDLIIGCGLNISKGENITIRNTVISNCLSIMGAAVVVAGSKNVVFENCIFHNNDSRMNMPVSADGMPTGANTPDTRWHGTLYLYDNYAPTGSETGFGVKFLHCNVQNNVGYGIEVQGTGKNLWENSFAFANTSIPLDAAYYDKADDATKAAFMANVMPFALYRESNVNGVMGTLEIKNSLFDERAVVSADGTTYSPISVAGGSAPKDYPNQAQPLVLSYHFDKNEHAYPGFVNGVSNTGISIGGDVTFYGRNTSFMPRNNNPMTNKAVATANVSAANTDMSNVYERVYGGSPDIGAIENRASDAAEDGDNAYAYAGGQKKAGEVVYVRDYNTYDEKGTLIEADLNTYHEAADQTGTFRDGSSWNMAINGNAIYDYEETKIITNNYALADNNDLRTSTLGNPENYTKYRIAMRPKDGIATSGNYYAYYHTTNGDFRGSDNAANGDDFILIENGNYYYIYDVTHSKYVIFQDATSNLSSNKIQLAETVTNDNGRWEIVRETGYSYREYELVTIRPRPNESDSRSNYSWNFHGGTTGAIAFWNADDNRSSWQFYLTTTTTTTTTTPILGLRYAIDKANEAWADDASHEAHDVFVGAGKYTDNLTIKEGVNVLGGFPGEGNPGEDERNISNNTDGYKTIIDGNAAGRVLTQPADFETTPTMIEGFIIQNGASQGENYGAGVKLMKNGIVKNCLIYNNTFTASTSTADQMGGGGLYVTEGGLVKNSTIRSNKVVGGQSRKIGGAGIYTSGGTFQNCLIVANLTTNNTYILGAGVILAQPSNLYNCTIAYNEARLDSDRGAPATGGVWDYSAHHEGGGIYTNTSKFYNCIVWGNYANGSTLENYVQIGMTGYTESGGRSNDSFFYCYSSGAKAVRKTTNKPTSLSSDDESDPSRVTICIRLTNNNQDEVCGIVGSKNWTQAYLDTCQMYSPFLGDGKGVDPATLTYELKSTAEPCINQGSYHEQLAAQDIYEDIVGNNRIIDCTVDKGAYEFYDSYAITPTVRYYRTADGNYATDATGTTVSATPVVDESKAAVFYVTPEGKGLASAQNPENAACAEKLQRVLDAAGRYRFQHPNQKIVVKVARSATDTDFTYYPTRTTDLDDSNVRIWSIMVPRGVELQGGYSDSLEIGGSKENNGFYRYEGTYADGAFKNIVEDKYSPLGNPTKFSSAYYNYEQNSDVQAYHVITFTDYVFDGDGKPYAQGDRIGQPSTWSEGKRYMLMGEQDSQETAWGAVTDRAVVDGIFITGGKADQQSYNSGAGIKNINAYGGGAIVTDYAHVRNCIVEDNQGLYGGGLALTHKALVTGTLIHRNTAGYGGGIYFFENGDRLSDGTTVVSENSEYVTSDNTFETSYDKNMARVGMTTIVNNYASEQGGGVWFSNDDPNGRFNACVLWRNACDDQSNVSGRFNVERSDGKNFVTTEYYPFNYCALENITASGLNNVVLESENDYGPRFYHKDYAGAGLGGNGTTVLASPKAATAADTDYDFSVMDDFGYYIPATISPLLRRGMPLPMYEEFRMREHINGNDLRGMDRLISGDQRRWYLDMGAMANDRILREKLMLRLFVSNSADVDPNAMLNMALLNNKENKTDIETYYSQQGSSFAYPMLDLQEALDYIYDQRGHVVGSTNVDANHVKDNANNMPFEIWLSAGTQRPSVDISDSHNYAKGNTFLIPEGVSIIGGFDVNARVDADKNPLSSTSENSHFYGGYYQPDYKPIDKPAAEGGAKELYDAGRYSLFTNVKNFTESATAPSEGFTYKRTADNVVKSLSYAYNTTNTLHIHHVDQITAINNRPMEDINANSVVEPWEFSNQTVLDGSTTSQAKDGVFHIVTALANERYIGALPHMTGPIKNRLLTSADGTDFLDKNAAVHHENGQPIYLDGLIFTGGYALDYHPGSLQLNEQKLRYDQGGAIMVDGNRYQNLYNAAFENLSTTTTEGTSCAEGAARYQNSKIVSAVAYRNIPLHVSSCKFENNHASFGGAISSNAQMNIFKSSFEHNRVLTNNEQVDLENKILNTDDPINSNGEASINITANSPALGGAICAYAKFSVANTLFANNEAYDNTLPNAPVKYSGLIQSVNGTGGENTSFSGCGGAVFMMNFGTMHVLNCDFVRNQANAYPALYTLNSNHQQQIGAADSPDKLLDYNQVVNTVFWGNRVNEDAVKKGGAKMPTTADEGAPAENFPQYFEVVKQIINYGRADRLTTADKGQALWTGNMPVAELDDDSKWSETIWFSAYEKGYGKKAVNAFDLRNMEFDIRKHIVNVIGTEAVRLDKEANGENTPEGWTYQNCNIEIDSINESVTGPNFVNPSDMPGYAGYNESSDWSLSRLNNFVDNGWGHIVQEISPKDDSFITKFVTYREKAPTYDSKLALHQSYGLNETEDDYVTSGVYPALHFRVASEELIDAMPLGTERYMFSVYTDTDGNPIPYHRISADPNPSHGQTYIDMGVYEYNHTQLRYSTEGDVDVLWVAPREKMENNIPDGYDWSQPTSDLQRAIETLLSSRNGHRKEIRLMDDEGVPGVFSPIYTIDNKQAFYINTDYMNQSTLKLVKVDIDGNEVKEDDVTQFFEGEGVMSLTIKGGYSYEVDGARDVVKYPTILRQQKRTNDGTSSRWDHLFYIKDPIQRYGKTDRKYEESNSYGAILKNGDLLTTIPIEFDGVTLINDQASPGTRGAAIYYADLTDSLTVIKERLAREVADWDSNDPTKKWAVKDQTVVNTKEVHITIPPKDGKMRYAVVEEPAKIILSKTTVMNTGSSGDTDDQASAVYLGDGHGSALLYNNVFHSNWGNPLEAGCRAVTLNNTFAKNRGLTWLAGEGSTIFNSVFWKNNADDAVTATASTYGEQFKLKDHNLSGVTYNYTADKVLQSITLTDKAIEGNEANYYNNHYKGDIVSKILKRNAYTGGPTAITIYSSSEDEEHFGFNRSLDDDNKNFLLGPNFIDPENSDIEVRDYNITPSVRLMNRGNNEVYDTLTVSIDAERGTKFEDGKFEMTETNIGGKLYKNWLYDMALNTSYPYDADNMRRIVDYIDLGAYEFQQQLQRVFYYDPDSPVSGTGSTWESGNVFGWGDLQNAIDLAALYHISNADEEAFVFAKGANNTNGILTNDQRHTGETITMRDGVTVYGGLHSSVNKEVEVSEYPYTKGSETVTYRYHRADKIREYLTYLGDNMEGFIGPKTNRTAVYGIKTNDHMQFSTDPTIGKVSYPKELDVPDYTGARDVIEDFAITSHVHGFHVTNTDYITSPCIYINPQYVSQTDNPGTSEVDESKLRPAVALTNICVYDNSVSSTATSPDVAVVKNALVYNSLFRNNWPQGSKLDDMSAGASVIRLQEGGWLCNSTVQGKTTSEVPTTPGDWSVTKDVVPFNGHGVANHKADFATVKFNAEVGNRIVASIVNYDGQETTDLTTDHTRLTLSGHNYMGKDHNLYYQLTEGSEHINEIPIKVIDDNTNDYVSRVGSAFLNEANGAAQLAQFIDFSIDRDLLGNPRLLTLVPQTDPRIGYGETVTGKATNMLLDRGAFETWKIEDDLIETSKDGAHQKRYGLSRHFAPHTGSVVYLMPGKSLVCGVEFHPGFLLLKEGASLYGNGQNVMVNYISVERTIKPGGSLVSLPFDMQFSDGSLNGKGVALPVYRGDARNDHTPNQAEAIGILDLEHDPDARVYRYDSEQRSKWDNNFFSNNSERWVMQPFDEDAGVIPANEAILFVPSAENSEDKVYAFTARSNSWNELLYSETPDELHKDVKLKRHDDWTSDAGGADFTSKEDMGWNAIGLPYLISEYKPYNKNYAGAGEDIYNMQMPHEMWLFYDGVVDKDGQRTTNGSGFYSVNSWDEQSWNVSEDATAAIWVGEGFFVQTATPDTHEWLSFYRPHKDQANPSPALQRQAAATRSGGAGAARNADGGSSTAGDVASDKQRYNVRYRAASTDKDDEMIDDFDKADGGIDIRVSRRTVIVRGLEGTEHIAIYDPAGRIYLSETNKSGDFSHTLKAPGVYIIAVDDIKHKFVVK